MPVAAVFFWGGAGVGVLHGQLDRPPGHECIKAINEWICYGREGVFFLAG